MHSVGPMCREVARLICSLLSQKIFLCRISNGHEAGVCAEASLCACGRDIVMRCTRVPHDKVTRFGADLLPLQALVLKPLHSTVGEAVPLVGPESVSKVRHEMLQEKNSPCPDLVWLVRELLVELSAVLVSTLANNETTIIGTIGQNIHKAL